MSISKEIRKKIVVFPDDYVFKASDFEMESQNQSAVVKALNRMAATGEISKLSKGKFWLHEDAIRVHYAQKWYGHSLHKGNKRATFVPSDNRGAKK
jgi:hypothetical protein